MFVLLRTLRDGKGGFQASRVAPDLCFMYHVRTKSEFLASPISYHRRRTEWTVLLLDLILVPQTTQRAFRSGRKWKVHVMISMSGHNDHSTCLVTDGTSLTAFDSSGCPFIRMNVTIIRTSGALHLSCRRGGRLLRRGVKQKRNVSARISISEFHIPRP